MNYDQLTQASNFLSSFTNPQKKKNEILTVNGYQEAKDFRLDRNESVAMLDSNADILYLKECDDIGKYSLKVFKCEDITESYVQSVQPQTIGKAEFDRLSKEISELKSLLMKGGNDNGKYNAKQ